MSLSHEELLSTLDKAQACLVDFRRLVEGGSASLTPHFCREVEVQGLGEQHGDCVMIVRINEKTYALQSNMNT